jgi:hypothetical protein
MSIAGFLSIYELTAWFHNIPNDACLSFADGDDGDLPVFLD